MPICICSHATHASVWEAKKEICKLIGEDCLPSACSSKYLTGGEQAMEADKICIASCTYIHVLSICHLYALPSTWRMQMQTFERWLNCNEQKCNVSVTHCLSCYSDCVLLFHSNQFLFIPSYHSFVSLFQFSGPFKEQFCPFCPFVSRENSHYCVFLMTVYTSDLRN